MNGDFPWLSGLAGLAGIILGGLFSFLLKLYPLRAAEREKILSEYRSMVAECNKHIQSLGKDVVELQRKQAHCEAENEMLKRQVAQLETRMEFLQVAREPHTAELSADISCDQNGVITSWDPASSLMFRWTHEEAIGKPITMLMPDEFIGQHQAGFYRMIRSQDKRPRHGLIRGRGRGKFGNEFPIVIVLSSWSEKGELRIGATIRLDQEAMAKMPPVPEASKTV